MQRNATENLAMSSEAARIHGHLGSNQMLKIFGFLNQKKNGNVKKI